MVARTLFTLGTVQFFQSTYLQNTNTERVLHLYISLHNFTLTDTFCNIIKMIFLYLHINNRFFIQLIVETQYFSKSNCIATDSARDMVGKKKN